MHCISVTYKTAPVEVREKFAWTRRQMDALQNEDVVQSSDHGAVVLSTCNRSEIYFSSDIGLDKMASLIKEKKGIDDSLFDKYAEIYADEDAERHLFEVTSGLDSMVLGEDEVQRQVKEAYSFAHELGKTGLEINMMFQGALRCSKKIKAETDIKYLPVSIGTLTANYSAEFAKKLGRTAKVLVIGATGKIGKVVAKDLIDLGFFDIYCTTRKHHIDFDDDGQGGCTEVEYDDRYGLLNDMDIVISATSSPHCTIYADEMRENVTDVKPRLLIDLAVPRDIDPEVSKIEGVELYDIDFIKGISEENNRKKAEQREQMESILDEVLAEVKEDIAFSKMLDEYKSSLDSKPQLRKELYKMRAGSSIDDIRAFIESHI